MKTIETKKWIGTSYNPFTGAYDDTYIFESKKVIEVHERPKYSTHKKAIVSGNIIEVMTYQKPLYYGYDSQGKGKKAGKKEKRADNIKKAQFNLRRLINTNVKKNSKFVTLTYKENTDDVCKAKKDFKRFIEKAKRKMGIKLKYVYVIEFQKRGAVHFHVVFFNLPYINVKELSALWVHGFIRINKIDNVDNVGAYVCKYMSKDLVDDRLNGFDLYGRSRDLEKPKEITVESKIDLLEQVYANKKTYSKVYDSAYHGSIIYTQYNTKRSDNQIIQDNAILFKNAMHRRAWQN